MWSASAPHDYLDDFHRAYYPAGYLVLHDRAHLYRSMLPVHGYVNAPIVALLFVPIAQLGRHASDLAMTAIDFAVVVAAFAGLAAVSGVRGPRLLLLAGAFLVNGPLYYSVRLGNLTHFVLLLFVGALWCIQARRGAWLGVLLAVAAVIKPPLILLCVPFLLRRVPGVFSALAVTLGAVAIASLIIFGLDLHLTWYRDTVAPYTRDPLGSYNVQSVDGFLARLFIGGHLRDFQVIEGVGTWFLVLRYGFDAAVFGSCFFVGWRARVASSPDVLRLELMIALCVTLLIGPISWTHYYCLSLVPVALCLGGALPVPTSSPWTGWLVAGALLVSAPVRRPYAQHAIIGPLTEHVLVSHYFYGGLVLLIVFLAARYAIHPRGASAGGVANAESSAGLEAYA